MTLNRRQVLLLLPAAAVAWEFALAGNPEAAPNYTMTEHWWGMLLDISKCIGCGSCVRACAMENDVPDSYFRTWIERYHISDWHLENPLVDSPDGGKEGFPPNGETDGRNFFVPKLCNHCSDSPCTPGLSGGRYFPHP